MIPCYKYYQILDAIDDHSDLDFDVFVAYLRTVPIDDIPNESIRDIIVTLTTSDNADAITDAFSCITDVLDAVRDDATCRKFAIRDLADDTLTNEQIRFRLVDLYYVTDNDVETDDLYCAIMSDVINDVNRANMLDMIKSYQ